jgi:hypothetical protein
MADVGLEQIEIASLARIRSLWPAGATPIVEFDISADPRNIVTPGIYTAAECTGFQRQAHDSFKKLVTLNVFLIFSCLSGPKGRRTGAHPLVLAIEQLLMGQTLGLDIQPLVPLRSPEITDAELRAALKIGFRVDLSTFYDITAMSDDEISDLLTIAASYRLEPDSMIDDEVPAWTAGASHAVNDRVRPTAQNWHLYKCTAITGILPGASGFVEPSWPKTTGGTVTDGNIVWTEDGSDGDETDFIDLGV